MPTRSLTPFQESILNRGQCPFCHSDRFLHGPRGGESENIRCLICCREFCLSYPFTSELIDRDDPSLYGTRPFRLADELMDSQFAMERMLKERAERVARPRISDNTKLVVCCVISALVGFFLLPAIRAYIYIHLVK